MSTRGSIGFRINGVDKISYNHSDSYPSGIGLDVLGFIAANDLMKITEAATNINVVAKDSTPTKEQIAELSSYSNLSVGTGDLNDWYVLLREAQGNLNVYTENGLKYMLDSSGFLRDSLFCEYAYIINLDTGMLEFYKGFNEDKTANGRYASLQIEEGDKYFGVVLLKEFPLNLIKEDTVYSVLDSMIALEETEVED